MDINAILPRDDACVGQICCVAWQTCLITAWGEKTPLRIFRPTSERGRCCEQTGVTRSRRSRSGFCCRVAPGLGSGADGDSQEPLDIGAGQVLWPGQVFIAGGENNLQGVSQVSGGIGLSGSQPDHCDQGVWVMGQLNIASCGSQGSV